MFSQSDGGWVGGCHDDDGGCSLVSGWSWDGGGYPLVGLGRWAGKAVHRVLTPQGLDFVNSMQSAGPAVHHCAELHSALLEFLYLMRFALY